jgi:hypothetical protein
MSLDAGCWFCVVCFFTGDIFGGVFEETIKILSGNKMLKIELFLSANPWGQKSILLPFCRIYTTNMS